MDWLAKRGAYRPRIMCDVGVIILSWWWQFYQGKFLGMFGYPVLLNNIVLSFALGLCFGQ